MSASQIVRFKAGKITFEAMTKVGSVLKFRDGKLGWDNVPLVDEVFKNSQKGERANSEELKAAFGTENVVECLKAIVEKGELQLTSDERKDKVEKKRAEIVNYIHKYYIDPKLKTPHPVVRIENALTTLKIKVDPDIPTERQCQDIVKKLPEVMPIRKMEMEGTLTVTHQYVGAVSNVIQQWAKVLRENYTSDGCTMELSMVPGDYDSFMSDLQKATKGDFQFDIAGQETATDEEDKGKKGGKKGAAAQRGRGKGKH